MPNEYLMSKKFEDMSESELEEAKWLIAEEIMEALARDCNPVEKFFLRAWFKMEKRLHRWNVPESDTAVGGIARAAYIGAHTAGAIHHPAGTTLKIAIQEILKK